MEPSAYLFLSADIVGSTQLKSDASLQRLASRFHSRKAAFLRLCQKDEDAGLVARFESKFSSNDQEIFKVLLEDASGEIVCDWMTILQTQFSDFHAEFCKRLKTQNLLSESLEPWKFLGDEVVYAIPISSRDNIHTYCEEFLDTLRLFDSRHFDGQLSGKGTRALRMKGTAWLAVFPVRNRVVELSSSHGPDFVGQDIDLGFRIAKCSRPGILCMTLDLALILANRTSRYHLKAHIIG